MLKLGIKVEDLGAKASVRAVTKAVSDKAGLHGAMATGVETEIKDHLQQHYVPRNKRGNFWERVHNSTEVHFDANGGEVALTETGVALRYYGGDVYPGKNLAASGPRKGLPTKALAIPSDKVPVSNGRQLPPARMGLLAFIRTATRAETVGVLVEGMEKLVTRGPRKGQMRIVPKPGGDLLYTLRTVTHHNPDEKILPPEDDMIRAAKSGAMEHIDSYE